MRLVATICGEIQRRAHRLEHVGVVVADEVVGDPAVHRQGVVEALVALDELLDRHRRAVGEAAFARRGGELAGLSAR